MKVPYIPKELLDIILEYDGRIKYKQGKYVNIINKNDERYEMIKLVIRKKIEILNKIKIRGCDFYFEFGFDICNDVGLCYDYGFNSIDTFEICYYNLRHNFVQIRAYL